MITVSPRNLQSSGLELLSRVHDVRHADVQHDRSAALRRRTFVEANLKAGNVGVDVRELQVIAALGHREAEHFRIESDRTIEVGDADLNEQLWPIPNLRLFLGGRGRGRANDEQGEAQHVTHDSLHCMSAGQAPRFARQGVSIGRTMIVLPDWTWGSIAQQ